MIHLCHSLFAFSSYNHNFFDIVGNSFSMIIFSPMHICDIIIFICVAIENPSLHDIDVYINVVSTSNIISISSLIRFDWLENKIDILLIFNYLHVIFQIFGSVSLVGVILILVGALKSDPDFIRFCDRFNVVIYSK